MGGSTARVVATVEAQQGQHKGSRAACVSYFLFFVWVLSSWRTTHHATLSTQEDLLPPWSDDSADGNVNNYNWMSHAQLALPFLLLLNVRLLKSANKMSMVEMYTM